MSNIGLTLALPAYNEADNIINVLEHTVANLETLDRSWEILVIDNCSIDHTVASVRRFVENEPRVRLVVHDENRLYSGSCASALRERRGSVLAIMDSDGQLVASDLPRFLAEIDAGADLVIGRRKPRHDPLARLAVSQLFNLLGWWYLRFPHRDLNCGFRVLGPAFADGAHIEERVNMANPELYVRAQLAGMTTAEVRVTHFRREGGASSHDFGRSLAMLSDVKAHFKRLRSQLRMKERSVSTLPREPAPPRWPGAQSPNT